MQASSRLQVETNSYTRGPASNYHEKVATAAHGVNRAIGEESSYCFVGAKGPASTKQ